MYRFWNIAGYLSKVGNFDAHHLHLAPPYRVTPVEFRGYLWLQKTRVPGLSCGVVCVILRLAVLVELRLVTDRQTDRQTQGHSIYRGCVASRGDKKGTAYIFVRRKQTSAYKLVQLSSFTGFCWCCRCSGYFKICGVLNIQRVFSRKIQNVDELRQRIVEEWERLYQRVIDNAVKQWRRRLRSCVAAKGGHFEQML